MLFWVKLSKQYNLCSPPPPECRLVVRAAMLSSNTAVSIHTSEKAATHVVLRVARAGLFCTMNYSTKYCSDCLELAEYPPAIEVIYVHKYFQIFIYFI